MIDFYLSKTRDEAAARRFFLQTIRLHGCPDKITIDGSAASLAALEQLNAEPAGAKLTRFEIQPGQIFKQYRGTRSPRHQTNHADDDEL